MNMGGGILKMWETSLSLNAGENEIWSEIGNINFKSRIYFKLN